MDVIDENQVAKIILNFRKGIFIQPIIALRDGSVIDGSHRVLAFRMLNMPIDTVFIDAEIEKVNPDELKIWLDER